METPNTCIHGHDEQDPCLWCSNGVEEQRCYHGTTLDEPCNLCPPPDVLELLDALGEEMVDHLDTLPGNSVADEERAPLVLRLAAIVRAREWLEQHDQIPALNARELAHILAALIITQSEAHRAPLSQLVSFADVPGGPLTPAEVDALCERLALRERKPRPALTVGETEYLVKWEIDVCAENPREAAQKARLTQIRPDTSAVVFDVTAPDGEPIRIDLQAGEATP